MTRRQTVFLGSVSLAVVASLLGWQRQAAHLAAHVTADGRVALDWQVPPALARAGLQLSRTYAGSEQAELPETLQPLGTAPTGHYVDDRVAAGVTYAYVLQAGAGASQRVEATLPDRVLPKGRHPAVWIDKQAYTLAVVEDGQLLKRYPIALGKLPHHRKLTFDNASTPEGLYHITAAQPHATYYRAYDLDYPNPLDQLRYRLARAGAATFPPIGGEVEIHGRGIARNWTWGCVALRDADMDELFAHPELGPGTEVRIWGGELPQADVLALGTPLSKAMRKRWQEALAKHHIPWSGQDGADFWAALGRFQQASSLPLTCLPDAATASKLGLPPSNP